jgi:hypothetical protein
MTKGMDRNPLGLTMRSVVGGFMCAVGAFAVSCQGDNCTTSPIDPGTLSSSLASKYILGYASSGGPQPYKYADSAGFQLRIWSDTLSLNAADKSYGERGRVGRYDPVSGDELIRNFQLASTSPYTLDASGNPTFPKLQAGSPGVGKIEPGYTYASLTIKIGTTTWYYFPAYTPP